MDKDILQLLEDALDSTLRELLILNNRNGRRSLSADSLAYWLEDECTRRSEEVLALAEIISRPTQTSLKGQLTAIGWTLFRKVGSTSALNEIAECVARRDAGHYEFRLNAIDSAFAGIGAGDDVWLQGVCV